MPFTPELFIRLAASLGAAALISVGAYRLHSLNRGGAIAACMVGTIVLWLGGWRWAAELLAFFMSSSVLSRAFQFRKQALIKFAAKGAVRDAGQVLGNGSIPAMLALLHGLLPNGAWTWIPFSGALAAVTADTWATELGTLSKGLPRLITRPQEKVQKGTSGGISSLGMLAAISGAAFIGLVAAAVMAAPHEIDGLRVFVASSLGGLVGSVLDSLAGATVQAMYFCPVHQQETEQHPFHNCGARTILRRGLPWLNNDWVNLICSASGAAVALLTYRAIEAV